MSLQYTINVNPNTPYPSSRLLGHENVTSTLSVTGEGDRGERSGVPSKVLGKGFPGGSGLESK